MNVETVLKLESDVVAAERAAREARGLPPAHVLDLKEFPFIFATRELEAYEAAGRAFLAHEPTNKTALLSVLFALTARGQFEAANDVMEQIAVLSGGRAMSRMRFGTKAPSAQLELPPVSGAHAPGDAFFLACDAAYLERFGFPLLKSIAAQNLATPLHIHLMAKDGAIIDRIMAAKGPMTVTATLENPFPFIEAHGMQPSDYFGAARLIRFAQALHHTRGALCMIDVDSLANGDPLQILRTPEPIAMRVRPGRLEPWNQFSACMVLGRPAARAYFDRVAAAVADGMTSCWWGLDQYALFAAWTALKPSIGLFGSREADVGQAAEGVFLFTAGAAKNTLLTDQTPYAQLFRKYRGPG